MRFGIVTPPVSGHLHPFGALGRELIARGHSVTVFHMPDLASRVQREGLDFCAIGEVDHPAGSLEKSMAGLAKLDGLAAVRFTVKAVQKTTEMICREGPQAMRSAGVDALLVDQMEPGGGAIAEHLGIPFVTICNALLLNAEPGVPPPFTAWSCDGGVWPRLRNRLGYGLSRRTLKPIEKTVGAYRKTWRLAPLRRPEDSYSPLAQISQQPAAFDFPRRELPTSFHYAGPLRGRSPLAVEFPWHRLDGRPLVYASLGTLQNRRAGLFRVFAEACQGLDVQLVLTHGGGLDGAACADLPGNPIVVAYAPQLEVLSKASLTLTHAGLNTVLDSLSCGVPVIALPITYEQPAIASRVRWAQVGEVVRREGLSTGSLREAIVRVMASGTYREKCLRMQSDIAAAGGAKRAADLIEESTGVHKEPRGALQREFSPFSARYLREKRQLGN